jgi:tRNA nucleotidyltransferase/poly(A) polymerase
MADYIYLLESRLSKAQQNALHAMREIAREKGLTIFLVGGAVRDLTSGSPVRDLDVVVQGNALKLKKDIEKAGGIITGEQEAGQALFVQFPGGVRLEVGSTLSVTYPKPGKPVVKSASILDDLRRRDFTANAMALSLNAGSYGLLMDPLNGVADIENRELRLVSNYGFIEDPIRMVRATRLMARLGWQMDEKTAARYETGKQEGYISAASAFQRGYETEEIVHEEDPLRVLRRLESEGWMKVLAPNWSSAKANVTELDRLRESQTQLQLQGIHPNPAAANFPLLTAKLSAKEIAELKESFPRHGFVTEIEALEGEAKELSAQLSAKTAALPSQAWKLLHAAKPEAVLLVAYSSKSPAIQAKFRSFYTEWPQAKQKVPYALLQEMRITSDLPGYDAFIESLIFELMDGKLGTVEEMKAFLEPFSPPAPPPPVHLRRPRAPKKEAKAGKGRVKKIAAEVEPDAEALDIDEEDIDIEDNPGTEEDAEEPEPKPVVKSAPVAAKPVVAPAVKAEPVRIMPAKNVGAKAAAPIKKAAAPAGKVVAPVKQIAAKKMATPAAKKAVLAKRPVAVKKSAAKPAAKKPQGKATAAKPVAGKVLPKVVAKKSAVKLPGKSTAKPASKAAVKSPTKPPAKSPVKSASKKAPAKLAGKPKGKPAVKAAAAKRR